MKYYLAILLCFLGANLSAADMHAVVGADLLRPLDPNGPKNIIGGPLEPGRFNTLLDILDKKTKSQFLFVKVGASQWCGPCQILEGKMKADASKFPDTMFIDIDISTLAEPKGTVIEKMFPPEKLPHVFIMKRKEKGGWEQVKSVIGVQPLADFMKGVSK